MKINKYPYLIIICLLFSCTADYNYIRFINLMKISSTYPIKNAKDITLFYGSNTRNYCKLYIPEKVKKNYIIFYIHGGGFNSLSPEDFKAIASYFINKGYIIAMPAYRYSLTAQPSEIYNDIVSSFIYVDGYLATNSSKPIKYILAGCSAGSTLAILLGANINDKINISNIKGILSFSGLLDFDECKNSIIKTIIFNFLGNDYTNNYIHYNPINYVQRLTNINTIAFHSKSDRIVEYENSSNFINTLIKYGNKNARLITSYGLTHDELIILPFISNMNETRILEDWLSSLDQAK